jgi:prolyl-tRNA synthetase
MRASRLLFKTLREAPADAETPSHKLMLRAGMLHQVASGIYSYGPLAQRSLNKVAAILREEMDAIGGQEVRLPAVQPLEIWEESGRAAAFGDEMVRLKDRRGRPMVIAPTHEEAVTLLAKQFIQSYRDLPVLLYQIQTKFRDEPRPRSGLIRVREFDMKDGYSFDANEEGLEIVYQQAIGAYRRIFARCGLPVVMVEADSGAIGGKDSHEFILPAEVGEDTIIVCGSCDYAANVERARGGKPPVSTEDPLPLEDVHTPGIRTIQDLGAFLGIEASKTLKAVFYLADGSLLAATIRGDLDVNDIKLKRALGVTELRMATAAELIEAGLVPGSASLVGIQGVRSVADDSIQQGSNFVAGANRKDYHLRNVNYPRDFSVDRVVDIAAVGEGHGCPSCGSPLSAVRGIEVGHVFKLGTVFAELLSASFLDTEGQQRAPTMGCYGIGLGRLLAAAIEENHDDRGMLLPASIAPFQVSLVGLNIEDPAVSKAAERLYARLEKAGIEVLFDDRQESAGVKFNDADLLGFPVRLVVSPRTLREGMVEVKPRSAAEASMTPVKEAIKEVKRLLADL